MFKTLEGLRRMVRVPRTRADETRVGFRGKGIILGGRGKFDDSKGEFDFNGQFNIANSNEAEYHFDGWISY